MPPEATSLVARRRGVAPRRRTRAAARSAAATRRDGCGFGALRLAVAMLAHDPPRLAGIVGGVAFAALLMVQQLAVFLAVMDLTLSTIRDAAGADLWVVDPVTQHLGACDPLRRADAFRIASVRGVAWAAAIGQRVVQARVGDARAVEVLLLTVDPAAPGGLPGELVGCTPADLRRPDAVVIDAEAASARLRQPDGAGGTRPARPGDRFRLGAGEVEITGVARCSRNFTSLPVVIAATPVADRCAPAGTRAATAIVAGVAPGADASAVAASAAARTGLRVETTAGFASAVYGWMLRNTGIAANFAVAVALGFAIGLAVAGLLFAQFVHDQRAHLAVLRALGCRRGDVLAIVVIQAALTALVGYGIGVGVAAMAHHAIQGTQLVSRLTPMTLIAAAGGVLAIASASAAIGCWQALRVDPAAVFRR